MDLKEFFTRIGMEKYYNNEEFMKNYKENKVPRMMKLRLEEFKDEKDVVLFAIKEGFDYNIVGDSLKTDLDIVTAALHDDGRTISQVPKEIVNKELAMVAVKQTYKAYYYLPDEFKEDFEICLTTFQEDTDRTRYSTLGMASFLDQYSTKSEKLSALRTGIELQAKNIKVPLTEDVFKIKERIDLAESLQSSLVKKTIERPTARLKI